MAEVETAVVEEQPKEQPKEFDARAYILQRNAEDNKKLPGSAQPPPKEEPKEPKEEVKATAPAPEQEEPKKEEPKPEPKPDKPKEPEPPPVPPPAKEEEPRLSRSHRRELNRLREEVGAERGRRESIESQLAELRSRLDGRAVPAAGVVEDPEPKFEAYTTEMEYTRALGRWEGRQAARTEVEKHKEIIEARDSDRAYEQIVAEMNVKALEDRKLFSDWPQVMEAAEEGVYEFTPRDHPKLMWMLNCSPERSLVMYYLAQHGDEWSQLLGSTFNVNDEGEQIRLFHRLEGKVEQLYRKAAAPAEKPKDAVEPPAAQAAPKVEEPKVEDRKHPADSAKLGRNNEPIPKPSSEVIAPGGTAPPEKPEPGTRAWMDMRNRVQYAR